MAVTIIPNVTNWSVTPQNGQVGYFTLMNTWLSESTSVIASLHTAIAAQNTANSEINNLAMQVASNATDAQNARDEAVTAIATLSSGAIDDTTIATNKAFSNQYIEANYYDNTQVYTKTLLDLKISTQQFDKLSKGPLFAKVSPASIKIPAGLKLTVGTNSFKLVSDLTLSLENNLDTGVKRAGTDYFVYAKSDAIFYISESESITTDRLIGGFHYGLVSEIETATGNKTEAMMVEQRGIWSHSCWDLKFKPTGNPRGMNFAQGIWVNIYLADEDIAIRGYPSPWKDPYSTTRVKAKIAAGTTEYGRAIPKIPLAFGGNGTLTYGKFTWFQACEIASSLNCFLLDYPKFPSLAYGVNEQKSSSTNGYETTVGAIEHYPNLTSRYMEQAAGVQWIWGSDVQGIGGTALITGVTDGRGDIYAPASSPTAVLLGGSRDHGVGAGSRASAWSSFVWSSAWNVGCRFACDHLELE